MHLLHRSDFGALLNQTGLGGVVVEVGVADGSFAREIPGRAQGEKSCSAWFLPAGGL